MDNYTKIIKSMVLVSTILLFSAVSLYPQNNFGTTTAEFLKIVPEAGPAGMGEAYMAVADDSSALMYNPAGLSLVDKTEVTLTQLFWFNDINMQHAAFAMPFEGGTGIGANILWIDFGSFDSTGLPPETVPPVNLQYGVINAGFGTGLGDIFGVGLNVKMLYEGFMDEKSLGISSDAGVIVRLFERNINLAFTAKNLGILFGVNDALPLTLGAGLGFRFWNGRYDYLNIALDFQKIINTDNIFAGLGIETTIFNTLVLRGGVRYNNALELTQFSWSDITRLMYFSGGVGINFAVGDTDVSIDYSYTPMGDLGYVQRIGLKGKFGESMYENYMAEKTARVEPKAIEVPKVDVEEGQIKGVSFKPNVPTEKVKEWKLAIKTSDGKIIKEFNGFGEVPKNLAWDGTDNFGKILKADADYVFDFKAKDMEGQIVKTIGHIVATKKFNFFEIKEERFVPIKGKEMLVAPVTLLVSSDKEERKQVPFVMVNEKIKRVKEWKFDITDASGRNIKRFKGKSSIPSYLVWDGKDFEGNYVDDLKRCKYTLTVTGYNGRKAEIKEKEVIRNPFIIASKTKKLKLAHKIYFEPNSFDLHPKMMERLENIAREIKSHKKVQVYIQGHSSREGDRTHNVILSQDRAKAVLRYFVEKFKISPLSITTVGYGADIPLESNDTEEGRMKNRRVEIIIMGEKPR